MIERLTDAGYVPVVAPIASSADNAGQLLNVNADSAAGALAVALGAQRLVFLTDVDGILNADGRLIKRVPLAHGRGDAALRHREGRDAPENWRRASLLLALREGWNRQRNLCWSASPSWLEGSLPGTAVA